MVYHATNSTSAATGTSLAQWPVAAADRAEFTYDSGTTTIEPNTWVQWPLGGAISGSADGAGDWSRNAPVGLCTAEFTAVNSY